MVLQKRIYPYFWPVVAGLVIPSLINGYVMYRWIGFDCFNAHVDNLPIVICSVYLLAVLILTRLHRALGRIAFTGFAGWMVLWVIFVLRQPMCSICLAPNW